MNKNNFNPYKFSVVQKLYEGDASKRLIFCKKILEHVREGLITHRDLFVTDESYIELSPSINKQNMRTWGTENPHAIIEKTKVPQKIRMWMAISGTKLVGPYFIERTVDAAVYTQEILLRFYGELDEYEKEYAWFQQDGTPCHTSSVSREKLKELFKERVISQKTEFEWPPRSPDLSACDFYLWGRLKGVVYKEPVPKTLAELRERIVQETAKITSEELERVFHNFLNRCQKCIDQEGGHFEHLC